MKSISAFLVLAFVALLLIGCQTTNVSTSNAVQDSKARKMVVVFTDVTGGFDKEFAKFPNIATDPSLIEKGKAIFFDHATHLAEEMFTDEELERLTRFFSAEIVRSVMQMSKAGKMDAVTEAEKREYKSLFLRTVGASLWRKFDQFTNRLVREVFENLKQETRESRLQHSSLIAIR